MKDSEDHRLPNDRSGHTEAMPSTAIDKAHGRQGGRWLPAGYVPVDLELADRCAVCDGYLTAGQTDRHESCTPIADELFPDM